MYSYHPKVSIVIPAYNSLHYLEEAIESSLAQTYDNIEVIVINDGSTDEGKTREIAHKYIDKIKYIEKENGGISSAVNAGIKNMSGDWVSWLCHDDLYRPEKIEKQIEFICENIIGSEYPVERCVLFTGCELMNANGSIIRHFNFKNQMKMSEDINAFTDNSLLVAQQMGKYLFHSGGCLIHRKAFEEIGYFDESLKVLLDVDFWFRLYTANYKLGYIPLPLVRGRVHSVQVSHSTGYSYNTSEQDMFWKKIYDWLQSQPVEKKPNLLYLYGCLAFEKGRWQNGDDAFKSLLSLEPEKWAKLLVAKCYKKLYHKGRNFAKRVYIKLFLK